mgnify:CR=1 FL=1
MKRIIKSAPLLLLCFCLLTLFLSCKSEKHYDNGYVTVYITPDGNYYHTKDCGYLQNNSKKVTLDKAVSMGRTPCSLCDPIKPYQRNSNNGYKVAEANLPSSTLTDIIIIFVLSILLLTTLFYYLFKHTNKRREDKIMQDFYKILIDQANNNRDVNGLFSEESDEYTKRRIMLAKGQCPDNPNYGYSDENPIMISSIFKINEYLKRLRTEDGQKFTWHRKGSFCKPELFGVKDVMIDIYQLLLDEKEYAVIYICPYAPCSYDAPKGMVLTE